MKLIALWITTLSVCLMLTACGGSSGSNSSTPTTGSSSSSQANTNADFSAISGLYNTTANGNEQYLYISNQGLITAYNYLGDGVDAGDNCYRESITGEANAAITGASLTHNTAQGSYTLSVSGGDTLTWIIAANGNSINRITYGGLSAAGTLSISSGGVSLRVPTARETSKSIEDILASLCQ